MEDQITRFISIQKPFERINNLARFEHFGSSCVGDPFGPLPMEAEALTAQKCSEQWGVPGKSYGSLPIKDSMSVVRGAALCLA